MSIASADGTARISPAGIGSPANIRCRPSFSRAMARCTATSAISWRHAMVGAGGIGPSVNSSAFSNWPGFVTSSSRDPRTRAMDFPTPDAPDTSNNMGYFFLSTETETDVRSGEREEVLRHGSILDRRGFACHGVQT